MTQFASRSYEEELMDDLNLANDMLRKNLDELAVINYWLGGNQVVLDALNQLDLKNRGKDTLHIADLGSGGGDTLRAIAHWARKRKIHIKLTGLDANQFMIDYATEKAAQYPEISFKKTDIFSKEFEKEEYDLFICSLFCHHFRDEQLIDLFAKLKKQSAIGFIINDLHRHWFAYHSIKWLTILFRGSYLVRNDAPLSVLRAFRRKELQSLLEKAGLEKFSLRWLWAFRWQVVYRK